VLLGSNVGRIVGGIENLLGIQFLSSDVYPISDFPSQVIATDVFIVCATAFVLTVLATIYPAWKAARTQPAEALRYE